MKRRYIYILLCLCFLGGANALQAQNKAASNQSEPLVPLTSASQISLLTCSPGNALYARYGHSALRVLDDSLGIDWVFNYGIFSFTSDHFYARFVKGETDYQLGVESMEDFVGSNAAIGRTTCEQVLNLTLPQRQDIADALLINYRPENRFYRYNFVFDNCATRPYYLLHHALQTDLEAPEFDTRTDTYRSLITHYTQPYSWGDFGINLIFGKEADQVMTPAQRLFLPEQLMNYVSEAHFEDGTPICVQDGAKPFQIRQRSWWLSPQFMVLLVCLLLLGLTYWDMKRKRISWWIDAVLFLVYGLLGCVGCYLTFFSLHPLVGQNWNLLFLNPLMFVPFVLILFPKGRAILKKADLVIGLYFYLALLVWLFSGQAFHCFIFIPIAQFLHIRLCWYREILLLGKHKKQAPAPVQKKGKKGGKRVQMLLVLLGLTGLGSATAVPRLTVVVAVDGLNEPTLQQMHAYWAQGGLRTLDEQAHLTTLSFEHCLYGGNEALATLMAGTNPCAHTFTADTYYSPSDRKTHSTLEDKTAVGIGTRLTLSPAPLLGATLTDRFKIQYPNERSQVYAVGIDPTPTILLAGHAANACCWLAKEEKEENGLRWVTTSFYPNGLPAQADQMNVSGRVQAIMSREWFNRLDISAYLCPTAQEVQKHGFYYRPMEQWQHSTNANALVTELALQIQQEEHLGTDLQPDMLLLQLTAVSPKSQSDGLGSAEQEDMLCGLNQDLGFLMEQLDKRVGKANYQLVVFGLPRLGIGESRAQKVGLPVRYFNVDRAAALTNTYLMAIYGHERWILGGYGQSIWLNRTLIEQKNMSLSALESQVSAFLLNFEGVENAFPASQLNACNTATGKRLQNSWNKRFFGDIVFTLQPFWLLGEDSQKRQSSLVEPATVPCYFYTSAELDLPHVLDATALKNIIVP